MLSSFPAYAGKEDRSRLLIVRTWPKNVGKFWKIVGIFCWIFSGILLHKAEEPHSASCILRLQCARMFFLFFIF